MPDLVVVAHPDDETLGMSRELWRRRTELVVVHVTDGAPRNLADARREGFSSWEDYAAARRREVEKALAGIRQLEWLGVADQAAVFELENIVRKIGALLRKYAPQRIYTHAYEGGHPDHDTVALAVHSAAEGREIWEFPLYRAGPGGSFVALPGAGIRLTPQEQERKRRMLECFATQRDVIAQFPVDIEGLRPAPRYDFTRLPHPPPLYYDQFDWGVNSARWLELAGKRSLTVAPRLRHSASYRGATVRERFPLTILSVAYPLAPVREDTAGGAEQVLLMLDRALVERGHRSLVVASEDSRPAGTLIPVPSFSGPLDGVLETARANHRRAIEAALEHWPVDLVHLHGQDFCSYLPPPGVPVLATLHVPRSWYGNLDITRPNTWMHCVSENQRRSWPDDARMLDPILNGIELEKYRFSSRKRRFALALGRLAPDKGFHIAARAAHRARVPLVLAGTLFGYASHEAYFRDTLRPALEQTGTRLAGPVGPLRKRRLLAAARCLLMPSLAPETASLAAMEALASGTPVIAFPAGALAEIVEHGRTGFLVRDEQEMAEAILRAGEIRPEDCLESARALFSARRTIDQYLNLYRRLTSHAATRGNPGF